MVSLVGRLLRKSAAAVVKRKKLKEEEEGKKRKREKGKKGREREKRKKWKQRKTYVSSNSRESVVGISNLAERGGGWTNRRRKIELGLRKGLDRSYFFFLPVPLCRHGALGMGHGGDIVIASGDSVHVYRREWEWGESVRVGSGE